MEKETVTETVRLKPPPKPQGPPTTKLPESAKGPSSGEADTASLTSQKPAPAPAEVVQRPPAPSAGKPAAPPPPPNLHEDFMGRLTDIFAGKQTPPDELFEPLAKLDPSRERVIGTIVDPLARELFSLAEERNEKASHLKRPRKERQVEEYKQMLAALTYQAKMARELFGEKVRALFPEHSRKVLTLTKRWTISFKLDDLPYSMGGSNEMADALRRLFGAGEPFGDEPKHP